MNIYGDNDPRSIPAYTLAEAAHYVHVPLPTVRSWVGKDRGGGRPRPLILVDPDPSGAFLLSFNNLIELHVLSGVRRVHRLKLDAIRKSVAFMAERLHSQHPLASHAFLTDGVSLFIEIAGQLVDTSKARQLAIRDVIELYLKRIERDEHGLARRLFPFTRPLRDTAVDEQQPRLVVIDPRIEFGRPVVAGTGITTAMLVGRYKAGDSIDDLAEDYRVGNDKVEEAIRCEMQDAA